MPAWLAPAITGAASLLGGALGNRAQRSEAKRNRQFQERMRNTQWQAAVADMEAAGLNPALAYSQGPNAAPGGSMASQSDIIGPGVSSAMAAVRMRKDLELLDSQIEKVKNESGIANAQERVERAKANFLLNYTDGQVQPIRRQMEAMIRQAEEDYRRQRLTGDVMEPLADLSRNMGQWLPILTLLSKSLPGGVLKAAGKLKGGK